MSFKPIDFFYFRLTRIFTIKKYDVTYRSFSCHCLTGKHLQFCQLQTRPNIAYQPTIVRSLAQSPCLRSVWNEGKLLKCHRQHKFDGFQSLNVWRNQLRETSITSRETSSIKIPGFQKRSILLYIYIYRQQVHIN